MVRICERSGAGEAGEGSSSAASAARPREMRLFTVPSGDPGPVGDLAMGTAADVSQEESFARIVRELTGRRS